MTGSAEGIDIEPIRDLERRQDEVLLALAMLEERLGAILAAYSEQATAANKIAA